MHQQKEKKLDGKKGGRQDLRHTGNDIDTIKGAYFENGSAKSLNAILHIDGDEFTIKISDAIVSIGNKSELKISERLGNIPRTISFHNDWVFTTKNNDSIDKIFKNRNKINRFVYKLESNILVAIVGILIIATTTMAFFKFGIPSISRHVADMIPQEVNQKIGADALLVFDKYLFKKSKLNKKEIAKIKKHFKTKLIPIDAKNKNIKYNLQFRNMGGIANAFALPSGDIILTDKFIKLSKNQDEIDSVLLHEMGHVVHNHGLEMVVQSTLVAVVLAIASGDNSGLGDLGIGLGSLLLSGDYSRGHENEADLYAFNKMLLIGIDPISFSNILGRITNQDIDENKKVEESEKNIIDYLSSHPETKSRLQMAKIFSKCFKKKLTNCDIAINQ
jgi:Zn-dependent protease with chaperone function